jgi:hypothetical protein
MSASILSPITGLLVFDATLSESYSEDVNVTEHPIDFGSNVADHAQPMTPNFTIVGVISETPNIGAVPLLGRLLFAKGFLERIKGQLVTVTSVRVGVRPQSIMRGFSYDITPMKGAIFTVRFTQPVIATAVGVLIPPQLPPPPQQVSQATEQSPGLQAPATAEISPGDQQILQSMASSLAEGFSGS